MWATFSGLNLNRTNATSLPALQDAAPPAAQQPVKWDRLAHVGARLTH